MPNWRSDTITEANSATLKVIRSSQGRRIDAGSAKQLDLRFVLISARTHCLFVSESDGSLAIDAARSVDSVRINSPFTFNPTSSA
jgi:hypothetical protein